MLNHLKIMGTLLLFDAMFQCKRGRETDERREKEMEEIRREVLVFGCVFGELWFILGGNKI